MTYYVSIGTLNPTHSLTHAVYIMYRQCTHLAVHIAVKKHHLLPVCNSNAVDNCSCVIAEHKSWWCWTQPCWCFTVDSVWHWLESSKWPSGLCYSPSNTSVSEWLIVGFNPFTLSYPSNFPVRNSPLHHLNTWYQTNRLLFSAALATWPCILISRWPG